MIRARLPFTTDGKATIIVGLATPDLDMLMIEKKPVAISLEELGIEVNLIVIARQTNTENIQAVADLTDKEVDLVVDKESERDFVKRIMTRSGPYSLSDKAKAKLVQTLLGDKAPAREPARRPKKRK